ncbi:GNAT family N-acetyltransferase [Gordonia caeni]|uniref:GNAT family N-acetyltransferase n=1 Tax=Gordonia caeni TaxID=1007097 RepID=A0ABP7PED9_9ACTN
MHKSTTAVLDPVTLYRILALRVDVFVVEQQCPYPELDGRDLDRETVHFWISDDDGDVLATLRLLRDDLPGGDWEYRIGRVCTAEAARGRGLTAQLMRAALDEIGTRASVLDAQSHLVDMYERFGYRVSGPEFLEDGIAHTPMRR